jgi:hypothetical protein
VNALRAHASSDAASAQVNLSMIKSNPICRLNIDNTG